MRYPARLFSLPRRQQPSHGQHRHCRGHYGFGIAHFGGGHRPLFRQIRSGRRRAGALGAPHLLAAHGAVGSQRRGGRLPGLLRYSLTPRYLFDENHLLPNARYEGTASNGSLVLEVDSVSSQIPQQIPLYDGNGSTSTTAMVRPRDVDHMLTYKWSMLSETSFTLCRFIAETPRNIDPCSGLRLMIWAENDDVLELGLKDRYDIEVKPPLAIHKGWAVYHVPLTAFGNVNLAAVTEFHIASTQYLKGPDSNYIRIALWNRIDRQ